MARTRAGDAAAREELCARYYPRVLRIVRARMGRELRALEEPDDIVQRTFVAALGALGEVEPRAESGLIQWFARLVEHQIHDALKHHRAAKRDAGRRVALEPLGTDSRGAHALPARGTAPSERASEAELARRLDECLAELPEDEREAIVLREYVGAGWDEVARLLGRPSEGAARELFRRAQVRLMEAFQRWRPS